MNAPKQKLHFKFVTQSLGWSQFVLIVNNIIFFTTCFLFLHIHSYVVYMCSVAIQEKNLTWYKENHETKIHLSSVLINNKR